MPKDDDETLCPSSSMNGKPVVSQLYLGIKRGGKGSKQQNVSQQKITPYDRRKKK
jgi:hypothetical protein